MYGSLKELLCKLKEFGFASPHAAFIVNLRHIELFSKNKVLIMKNGQSIPIAQTKQKLFRKIYFDFISL